MNQNSISKPVASMLAAHRSRNQNLVQPKFAKLFNESSELIFKHLKLKNEKNPIKERIHISRFLSTHIKPYSDLE